MSMNTDLLCLTTKKTQVWREKLHNKKLGLPLQFFANIVSSKKGSHNVRLKIKTASCCVLQVLMDAVFTVQY